MHTEKAKAKADHISAIRDHLTQIEKRLQALETSPEELPRIMDQKATSETLSKGTAQTITAAMLAVLADHPSGVTTEGFQERWKLNHHQIESLLRATGKVQESSTGTATLWQLKA